MKTLKYILAGIVVGAGILLGVSAHASILQGYQGGTGFGPTTSSTNAGYCLTVASTTPWLTYSFQPCGGSGATTTINGVSGPTFTFNASSTGTDFTISTSTGNIFFNFPTASASARGLLSTTDWNTFNGKISTSTGLTVANFATSSISQWNNNAGYLTGTKVDSFNTRTGVVSLTSGDVTGALGFTPANQSTTISAGGILSGGGDLSANRTISLSTSTLYSEFSALGTGLTYNTSTGAFTWTNPGYISNITLNGVLNTNFSLTGSGNVTSTVTGTSTVFSLTGVIPSTNGGTATTTAVGSLAFQNTPSAGLVKSDGSTLSSIANATGTPFYKNGAWSIGNAVDAYGNQYSTSTGGGTPGGSDTQVQFNNGGSFGATSTFTVSSSTGDIHFPGNMITGGGTPTFLAGGLSTSTVTNTFSTINTTSTFTVPAGVTSITITAKGGKGAAGNSTTGGNGGQSVGTLSVTPGTTYYVYVGASSTSQFTPAGMSWVSASSSFATSSVIIVAAGGGAGGGPGTANGGAGGGTTGSNGTAGNGGAGLGGTQTAGGAAGNGDGEPTGGAGTAGHGGVAYNSSNGRSGGSGGDGYFGGGSGGSSSGNIGGGGGGGSSYLLSSLTATSTTSGANSGDGSVVISYASPGIVGTDNAGQITFPVTGTTSTITFARAFSNPPSCWVTPNNATNSVWIAPTVSSIAITFQNALTSGQTFNYGCLGY